MIKQYIAGPGTGKTTTIIKDVVELLENSTSIGIVVCTFTRKATEELQIRLYSELNISSLQNNKILIGTIHSICLNLLKEYDGLHYSDFSVLTEDQQIHYIYTKLPNFGVPEEDIKKKGWSIAEELAYVFNKLTDCEIDISKIPKDAPERLITYCEEYYPIYKQLLARDNYFDFATIQEKFFSLICKNETILRNIQKEYNYYFVDEYQDVNHLQDVIFKKLASKDHNFTIVGDDDQSIYRFRGSDNTILLNFINYYKEIGEYVKQEKLEVNYRSISNIVGFNNYLINKAPYTRLEKKITHSRKEQGINPLMLTFDSDEDEAQFIAGVINYLYNSKIIKSYSDCAIIFRSLKYHSIEIQKSLEYLNIPFKLFGAGNFFESIFSKEIFAIFDFILSHDLQKRKNFFDSINLINNKTSISAFFDNDNLQLILDDIDKKKNKFKSCIEMVYEIYDDFEFYRRYNDGENFGILTNIAAHYDELSDYFDPYTFYSYLSYLKRSKSIDFFTSDNIDAVNLITIHQSKGLEFPVVFMPSQNKRNPITNITDFLEYRKRDLDDEERRIFYVGATRAEDLLLISNSKTVKDIKKTYIPNTYFRELEKSIYASKSTDHLLQSHLKCRHKTKSNKDILYLSYSRIQQYIRCPLEYKLRNIWHLATVRSGGLIFGSNIHKILEAALKEFQTKNQALDLIKLFNVYWNDAVFRTKTENDKFKQAAYNQVNNFVSDYTKYFHESTILAVEEPFNISLGNIVITGRFDLCIKTKNEIEILDFKTGERKDYDDQLLFYSYCYYQKHGIRPNKLSLYYLKSAEKINVETKNDSEVLSKIHDVANKIRSKIFPINIGTHCSDCSYNKICMKYYQ